MNKISLIASIDINNALGYKNELLFKDSSDLAHFKKTTEGSVVIMGRKTYESIGKPLPNRHNIILTTDESYELPEGAALASSLDDALCKAYEYETECFILGGGELYKQTITFCDSLIITEFNQKAENADTYFPEINLDVFKLMRIHYLKPHIKIKYYDRK